MFRKAIAGVGTTALALGLVAITAAPASAHDRAIQASCEAGVEIELTHYQSGDPRNTLDVWIDGVQVEDAEFEWGHTETYPFTPNATGAHTYRVVIDARDGTDYDHDSGTVEITGCATTPPAPTPAFEVGLYLYKKLDPGAPASWENSGPQSFVASKPGAEWYSTFPTGLPLEVCGDGWAVQQDKVSYTGDGPFAWPATITAPHDNIGWPPIYDAKHHDLEQLVEVPDCVVPEPVKPAWYDEHCSATTPFTVSGAAYSLTLVEGITYRVKVGSGGWNVVDSEGPHAVPVGLFGTTVKVRAFDAHDVALATWTHEFDNVLTYSCFVQVSPVEPEVDPAQCTDVPGEVSQAGYTLADVTGVRYLVSIDDGSWKLATAGVLHELSPGDRLEVLAVGKVEQGYYIGLQNVNERYFGPYTIDDPDCVQPVKVVGDPVFWNDVCDESGGLDQGFEVVAADHVTYTWDLNGVDQGAIAPGVYGVGESDADLARPGDAVEIVAHADPGFELDQPYSWAWTFQTDDFCLSTLPAVTPVAAFAQITCDAAGTYSLGTEESLPGSVLWSVDGGAPFSSGGTFPVNGPGSITVAAVAAPGYGIVGSDPDPTWTFDFAAPDDCGDLETLALSGSVAGGALALAGALLLGGVLVLVARRRGAEV